MSSQERITIHIHRPGEEDRALLRLLTPAEKLQALVAAAKAKAARLGAIDTLTDTRKEGQAGSAIDDGAHQEAI